MEEKEKYQLLEHYKTQTGHLAFDSSSHHLSHVWVYLIDILKNEPGKERTWKICEDMQATQLKFERKTPEIKSILDRINHRLDTAEEKISVYSKTWQ